MDDKGKEVRIEFDSVSFSYKEYNVLRDLSFKVYDRDIVTVVGPNGGGKTTMLKLILGLLKPDSGTIKVNGKSRPGYVPQYTLFDTKFPATVFDVVLTGRITGAPGFYSSSDREFAEKALLEMKLQDVMKRPFSALSGGQRQRVLIARALAGDPDILLLDEPTANVDASVGSYLSDYILNLEREFTIMLVTHDMGFVNSLIGRVFCINRNLHEHPLEKIDSDDLYGPHRKGMQLVRHDIKLFSPDCGSVAENGEQK
ncbi:MAG: ABC transporter ATP-binding protein [Spirochaetia bacterium]|jgi:zinc transport system ATP-binding protein|nr:ABC transporter ATP-binding protein [Spirochaetia bacterium]